MSRRRLYAKRAAQGAGCLLVGLAVLCLAGMVLLWLLGVWLNREDWSDIRFFEPLYLGRVCDDLRIEAEPWGDAVVTITNARDDTVRDLRVTVKYFAGPGPEHRPVREHRVEALPAGEAVTFDPPEEVGAGLGMIYVLVRSDKGYAVLKAWYSFWS